MLSLPAEGVDKQEALSPDAVVDEAAAGDNGGAAGCYRSSGRDDSNPHSFASFT